MSAQTPFENPSAEALRDLLQRARRIAVIGLSPNPDRASHRIGRRLQSWSYNVIPVHPNASEVLGEKAYARLADAPGPIDLVNVFRPASEVVAIVEECIALGLPAIWMQDGIVNEEAALRARAAGMLVVMDRCISREYRKLLL